MKADTILDQKMKIYEPRSFLEKESVRKFIEKISKKYFKNDFECEFFSGKLLEKLIENDFSALHKYCGNSSRRTYLTSIAKRLAIDIKRHMYGRNFGRNLHHHLLPPFLSQSDEMATLGFELIVLRGMPLSAAYEHLKVVAPKCNKTYGKFVKMAEGFPLKKTHAFLPVVENAIDEFNERHFHQTPHQFTSLMKREIKAILLEVIGSLDHGEQSIIGLTFFKNMPAKDAAKSMGIKESAFRKRLAKVLHGLRSTLQARGIQKGDSQKLAITG